MVDISLGEEAENPFDAPKSLVAAGPWKTAAGFTSGQCFVRFFIAGIVAAVVGGVCLFKASQSYVDIAIQLGSLGLPFAAALMLSIRRWIGSLTIPKLLFVLIGAAAGFIACGIVYIKVLNVLLVRGWNTVQPVTWRTLAPCFCGAAAGSAVISITLWLTGGRFTWKRAFVTWTTMTSFGFTSIALSDEIGMRRRIVSEALSSGIAGGVYVAVVLAMLGWYLAEANGTPVNESNK